MNKYKGVTHVKKTGKYRAYLSNRGVSTHLGVFDTDIDAAKFRDEYIERKGLPCFKNFKDGKQIKRTITGLIKGQEKVMTAEDLARLADVGQGRVAYLMKLGFEDQGLIDEVYKPDKHWELIENYLYKVKGTLRNVRMDSIIDRWQREELEAYEGIAH